jgi:hypothetical protein
VGDEILDDLLTLIKKLPIMDLKGLYQIAKKELTPLYDGEPIDLRLEQAERSEDTDHWNVVVSYLVENKNQSKMSVIATLPYERVYKLLKINENKEVEELLMFNEV